MTTQGAIEGGLVWLLAALLTLGLIRLSKATAPGRKWLFGMVVTGLVMTGIASILWRLLP